MGGAGRTRVGRGNPKSPLNLDRRGPSKGKLEKSTTGGLADPLRKDGGFLLLAKDRQGDKTGKQVWGTRPETR